jgi:glutathione gamma-glutamylcysteinyltransferase
MVNTTYHRRPLPLDLVAFGSPEGRTMLAEALAAGTANAFFPLVAHLHTQSEPAWCGLGTLVTVLNALEIDPGRTWKGPWRFFGEELLSCCKSLEESAASGLSLDEVACIAACNGADVTVSRYTPDGLGTFRSALEQSVRAADGPFVVCNYARSPLGQTGDGHFSPIAALHPARDQALVLDVARFKYPPHWVPVERLYAAMAAPDSETGQPRGWLSVGRAPVHSDEAGPPPGVDRLVDRLRELSPTSCLAVPGAPCVPKS